MEINYNEPGIFFLNLFLVLMLFFTAIIVIYELKFSPKPKQLPTRKFKHLNNKAIYILLVDFGDEVCVLREDINVRLLMKRDQFEKFLVEVK